MMHDALINSQIRSLEIQLKVLKARVGSRQKQAKHSNGFAELYGILAHSGETSEEILQEAKYKMKWNPEEDIEK